MEMATEQFNRSNKTTRNLKLPLKGLSTEGHCSDKKKRNNVKGRKVVQDLEEEDIEEDETQIESSMPPYLDHIFGTCMSFSQEPPAKVSSVSNCLQFTGRSKEMPTPTQQDLALQSQGFDMVKNTTPQQLPSFYGGVSNSDVTYSREPLSADNGVPEPNACDSPPKILHTQNSPTQFPFEVDVCHSGKLSEKKFSSSSKRKNANYYNVPIGRKRRRISEGQTYEQPPSCVVLKDCVEAEKTVNILALVLQVNSPMVVKCKRGLVAGQTVLMSSLLLADPTKAYFKLTLWREAAAWAERIAIGDVVYLKNIRLKPWNNEVVGTTIKHSSILNLHQPNQRLPQKVQESVPDVSLSSLMKWGRNKFAYLFASHSEPKSQRDVAFHTSRELTGNTLVHFRAKLLCIVSSRVVLMADTPDVKIHIHLIHPPAPQWHAELSAGLGQIWECMYMAVVNEETCTQNSGAYTLQTTFRTTMRKLSATCSLAADIAQRFPSGDSGGNWITSCHSMAHMMMLKQSGIFKVNGTALKLEFLLPEGRRLHLCSSETGSLLCQAVYVGCETCSSPLPQDENGVYCQCMPCILKSLGRGYPSSAYCFRPLLVTLQDSPESDLAVAVSASHVVIPKVIGCTGKDVVQASISESFLDLDLKTVKAEWVIQCSISKDENSFVEEISFTLLDVYK